jgi:hypothetical protein
LGLDGQEIVQQRELFDFDLTDFGLAIRTIQNRSRHDTHFPRGQPQNSLFSAPNLLC